MDCIEKCSCQISKKIFQPFSLESEDHECCIAFRKLLKSGLVSDSLSRMLLFVRLLQTRSTIIEVVMLARAKFKIIRSKIVSVDREKKKTEDFLNDENLVVDFSSMPDGPDDLPTKYQDAIAKSRENLEGHREALRQLRERAQVADVEMEKIVDRVELAAMKQRRKVAEAMAAMKRKGNLEEEKTKLESIETLLVSDDSGIGVDASTVCGNNNNLAADHKHP